MNDIDPIQLGEPGRQFVIGRLRDGGALSERVLSAYGDVYDAYAPLPRGVDFARILQFESGGIAAGDSMDWFLSLIGREYKDRNFSILIEDAWALTDDRFGILGRSQNSFLVDQTVVYWARCSPSAFAICRDLWRSVITYHFTGFIAACDVSTIAGAAAGPSADAIEALISQVTYIFASAYDQEAIVIARPGRRP